MPIVTKALRCAIEPYRNILFWHCFSKNKFLIICWSPGSVQTVCFSSTITYLNELRRLTKGSFTLLLFPRASAVGCVNAEIGNFISPCRNATVCRKNRHLCRSQLQIRSGMCLVWTNLNHWMKIGNKIMWAVCSWKQSIPSTWGFISTSLNT